MATAQEQSASSPATRWQRTCRWLKRMTAFLWGTIIVGFFINVVSTISTSTTAPPLSKLLVVHWVLTYPIPVISGAGVFLLLTVVSWVGSRERKASSFPSPEQQSRVILLKSLRKAYTDELASSLQGMARITLGLHERFDLTHRARLSPWRPGQSERTLPGGTTIIDAYDQAGNGLLILGEPGAGKSTLLYYMAQALLKRAEQDERHPLPVILNLSSWATRRLPLETWLVEELQGRYLIPRQQGQRWVQQTKFLPLLDGLDEVASSARDACIKAINAYQSDHLMPLVVCSRREEYQAMSERLTLQSVVVIQPLSSEQVKDYLARAGEELAAVQTTMNTNPVLQELLTTPLMLNVMTLTYKGKTVKDLPQLGSPEEQQRQVFEHYITQALEKKRERPWRYASQPASTWLSWLAQQMQQRNLTEFYLEYLQFSWLPTQQAQTRFIWLLRLGVRLGGGLVGELLRGLLAGLGFGLVGGLLGGLVGGLVFGLLLGLGVRLGGGLVGELLRGLRLGLLAGLFGGLVGGLFGGLLFGLLLGLGFGGGAYLTHYSLRYLLWRSGVMPWHAVRFLNEASERVLLQAVGGGYRFIHPLFQQYFASLHITAPSTDIQ